MTDAHDLQQHVARTFVLLHHFLTSMPRMPTRTKRFFTAFKSFQSPKGNFTGFTDIAVFIPRHNGFTDFLMALRRSIAQFYRADLESSLSAVQLPALTIIN